MKPRYRTMMTLPRIPPQVPQQRLYHHRQKALCSIHQHDSLLSKGGPRIPENCLGNRTASASGAWPNVTRSCNAGTRFCRLENTCGMVLIGASRHDTLGLYEPMARLRCFPKPLVTARLVSYYSDTIACSVRKLNQKTLPRSLTIPPRPPGLKSVFLTQKSIRALAALRRSAGTAISLVELSCFWVMSKRHRPSSNNSTRQTRHSGCHIS